MSDILHRIVERKRERLREIMAHQPLAALQSETAARAPGAAFRFSAALRLDGINIIAEIKRRSPSKGVIRENFDPVAIARNYTDNGAAAISILTEEDFFDGSLDYLRAARAVTGVPLLRKDFIFDEYQIHEAALAGADCILLIAAMFDFATERARFNDLMQTADGLGLDALIEIHDAAEAELVLRHDVRLLGVNNRNLRTFVTTLDTSISLAKNLPPAITLVSESGIRDHADIQRLRGAGYHAFLIGEQLMRAADEGAALRGIMHG